MHILSSKPKKDTVDDDESEAALLHARDPYRLVEALRDAKRSQQLSAERESEDSQTEVVSDLVSSDP